MFLSLILAGCSGNGSVSELHFSPAGDGTLHPDPESMDAFIGRLTQATPEEAAVLLDQGFSLADSLSCADPQSMALYWFADELASRLDGVGSPTRDARLFSMALDRQQQCASLEPDDWRRITFFRERLALNSPGFAVSDIPLLGMAGDTLSLRTLCRAAYGKTLLFLYGSACKACSDIANELSHSSALAKQVDEGNIVPITLYVGDDKTEQERIAATLPAWKHYADGGAISFGGAFDTREIPSLYLHPALSLIGISRADTYLYLLGSSFTYKEVIFLFYKLDY